MLRCKTIYIYGVTEECSLFIMDVMRLSTPLSWLICGLSMSGKTRYINKLLQNADHIFDRQFEKIYYCYAIDQPLFQEMKKNISNIVFYQGLPDMEQMTQWSKDTHILIIFDDFQEQISSSKDSSDLLLLGTHHLGISSVITYQNLFPQNKYARNIALNTQVYTLFRNRRDMGQLTTFSKQALPGKCTTFAEICKDAFNNYGYIVAVMDPRLVHSELMLRSNIFPGDGPTVVYTC